MSVDFDDLARRFVVAQLAGDRAAATQVVIADGLDRGARVIDLQALVIRTAQHEIGRLWETNQISVAQEHLATAIAQIVMAQLVERAPPPPRLARTVAVACVEAEHHDLPARLVADYLEHAGFTVRFYGANLPTADLIKGLRADPPHALALSATMTFHLASLRAAVAAVRAELPALPILVGGHAVTWSPGVVTELGVATAEASPDGVIARMRELTEVA